MRRLVRKGVTARAARADDLDAVLPVLRAARSDSPLGAQLVNPDAEALSELLHAWFGMENSSLIIAEVDDAIVGLALCQLIDVNLFSDIAYMHIEALYVGNDHRRRGVGRALMQQIALAAARSAGERVVTMPLTGARSEQRFLSGLGFAAAGSRRVAETAALLRRLEQPPGARDKRVRGIDELIARRRRSRGLPETPPGGLSLVALAARADRAGHADQPEPSERPDHSDRVGDDAVSSTMHVSLDVQTRRPDSSATAIS